MINQYGNYTVTVKGEKHNANGQLTLGEVSLSPIINLMVTKLTTSFDRQNIADNGGIKQSYRVFKKLIDRGEYTRRLPGLNMTQEQMFFLKYAQSWCQIITDEGTINAIKTWRHSLGRFR